MWGAITPADWMTVVVTVLTLVVLEGLLSADNALVLAVMVRHLPKSEQKQALRFGIWGAFVFRFIAVLLATHILDYWQFEVVGGVYLLYLALTHLIFAEDESHPEKKNRTGRGFWGTVVSVELADIAFSIDSILAAVGLANEMRPNLAEKAFGPLTVKEWTIYAGGVLGIVMMRFVAGVFLILLDRYRGLAAGAYVLVAWIGLKLVGEGFHHALFRNEHRLTDGWHGSVPDWLANHLDMNAWIFWGGMVLILILSLLYQPREAPGPETLQPKEIES